MQQRLFDHEIRFALDEDPYEEVQVAGQRLASEYAIDESEGFDMILAYGSEAAARRALRQRWWLGEVELRSARAA